jgi:hypothetical protein
MASDLKNYQNALSSTPATGTDGVDLASEKMKKE